MRIAHLITPVIAATKAEAEDKCALLESLPIEEDSLMLLSEVLNFDFGSKPLDEPFSDEELASMSGLQAYRDRAIQGSGKSNPSIRDFINVTQRGRLRHPVVGGPKDIADHMEEFFTAPGCDGFVISASCVPGTYEDFVTFVVPELAAQRALPYRLRRCDTARKSRPCATGRSAPGKGVLTDPPKSTAAV